MHADRSDCARLKASGTLTLCDDEAHPGRHFNVSVGAVHDAVGVEIDLAELVMSNESLFAVGIQFRDDPFDRSSMGLHS